MRYALKVAYDGTNFCGWQIQPNGRTVQEEMNKAVLSAFGESACVVASGRTDSGVHAAGQVCHVDLLRDIAGAKLADALNFYLPEDVSVLASCVAPEGFDANRSAKRKTYVYRVYASKRRNPLKERFAIRIKTMPPINLVNEACSAFVGEHDFAAYCAAGSSAKTTRRQIYSFSAAASGVDLTFSVCGNGFLYNMVRTLVGTVLSYAAGKITFERIEKSLDSGNRALAGKTMPPAGLTLEEVDYGFPLFKM